PTTARARPSGSRPRGWCSSKSRPGGTTAASMRSLTTPAATCSTCTRTDRGGTVPESSDVQHRNRAPAPSPELQRLGALVGRWRSQGHIVGDPAVPITGTDVYEWLAGGFFLVHPRGVVIGDQQVRALELIGSYDPATDAFTARAYDNLGNVTIMRAWVDDQGVGTFTGGGGVAPVAQPAAEASEAVRSTLTISLDRGQHDRQGGSSHGGASWEP